MSSPESPPLAIEIRYCRACHFGTRATWVAQELLNTYAEWISGLTLVPSGGGIFEVKVNGSVIFSNADAGRFPEIRELKEAINNLLDDPPAMAHPRE